MRIHVYDRYKVQQPCHYYVLDNSLLFLKDNGEWKHVGVIDKPISFELGVVYKEDDKIMYMSDRTNKTIYLKGDIDEI